MMVDMRIRGAKAGQKEPRKPNISKDTAASISTAKLLYGLAEGEVYGLADGAKSIRLDGTPLVDDAGSPNFEGVTWDFRNGSNDQEYIKGFPDVSNETPINVELRSSQPWIKAFNDTQISAVRVRFKWNRLSETNGENGDVKGYKIDYAIDLQTDGGAYQTVLTTKIQDKTSAGYERTHRIDLPKAKTGWQLRVRRITPNSTSDLIQDTMMIDAVAEVIDVKLSYPNTALLGIQYNAELFSNIAKMSVRVKGKIIRVPDNYDPVARTYTGIWTGNFKDAYSNNPAWIFYDLCTQWRGGLGERLDATMIDRWSLYALGQYCDQPVSDGQGGLEPRFTCNVYLQKQEEAYTVLQNIAGIFRAMSFWTGERIMLDADVPQDSIYTYSSANIVGGVAGIQYSGTRNRDRHTLAKVAWDNPNNDYQTEYEYVRDEKAMSKFGVKVLDLSAFGCTSQAQAQRAGLWALKTEQLETRQVTFSVGLDGAIPTVGNIISLSDEAFAGRANGGRVSTVNSTQRIIELDREVTASAGDVLIINGGSGKSERRNISNVVGNRITVTAGFTSAEPEHVWAIETADLKLMRFRVMSITENDDATYAITAIQHEPQKYDAIDFGTDVKPTEITIINPDTVDAPASVTVTSRHREVQGQTVTTLIISWSQVKGAVAYDAEWRKDDGTWVKVPRTGNVSVEIDGVYSGNYMARVRAISAFDVQSNPTSSMLTEVKGKIGLPPTVVGLTAIGILFGMDLKWGFAAGSGDAAFTEIQVGSAPDVNVATLTQVSYPTNTHTITGLQGNLNQSYRARLVDKLGFKSPWSAWVTGTTDANADKIMDLLQGQINEGSLNQILTTKIEDIKINKDSISQETQDRIDAIIDANSRIDDTNAQFINYQEDTGDEFKAQGERLDGIIADYKPQYADKTHYANISRSVQWTYWKTVAADNYTSNQRITNLQSEFADSNANFTNELFTLATKDKSIAADIKQLYAETGENYGLIQEVNIAISKPEGGLAAQVTELQGRATAAEILLTDKGEIIFSYGTPPVLKEGKNNVWFKLKNEDNGTVSQTPHQWDGTSWVELKDSAALAAKADAAAAKTAAENKGEVIYSATAPIAAKRLAQNLWIDTSLIDGKPANTPKRWNGSAWIVVTDKAVGDAQAAANAAAQAAGNKGEVIFSSSEPTADKRKVQNLWIDTSGGKNTPKRWAGSSWLTVTDKAATDAQAAADKANRNLEPANLASLVEGSGAFSDEFGSISGQFANFEAVVNGQKTAMEVISGIGNAEKLKNEIAKARLDKNVTNLNAQSVALTTQINGYTTKIADVTAKRNATTDTAIKAEYNKLITDLTAAKADLTAQKAVIADQVTQLAAEKKVLDDFKEVEDGVRAQHTVKIDNDGKIVGFGLVLQKDGFSAFDVRADRFSISAPVGKPNDVAGNSPFMVLTNQQTIDGVTVPAGVYARNFYAPKGSIDTIQIKDAAIKSAQIDDLAVTTGKIDNLAVKSANIDNLAVTTGKIANLAVDTLQINDYAVTIPVVKRNVGEFAVSGSIGVVSAVHSSTFNYTIGFVSVQFAFERLFSVEAAGAGSGYIDVIIKRNNLELRRVRYNASLTGRTEDGRNLISLGAAWQTYAPIIDVPPVGNNTYTVETVVSQYAISNPKLVETSFIIMGVKK